MTKIRFAYMFLLSLALSACGGPDIGSLRSALTFSDTPYRDNAGRIYPIRVADRAGHPYTDDPNAGAVPPEFPRPASGCDWYDSYFSDEDVEPPIPVFVCRCLAVKGEGALPAPPNTIPTSVYFRSTPYDSTTPVATGYVLCFEKIGEGCLRNNRTGAVTCR